MQHTANQMVRDEQAGMETQEQPEQALRALVAEIASDSISAPEQYLRETVVPEGGE